MNVMLAAVGSLERECVQDRVFMALLMLPSYNLVLRPFSHMAKAQDDC